MDDQKKDHIAPKTSSQRNRPKKLQTHNMHTYDVENTNGTNKGNGVTSSHTTLGSVTSIGPHLVPFKPGSNLSKLHGPTTPYTALDPDKFSMIQPYHTHDLNKKNLHNAATPGKTSSPK